MNATEKHTRTPEEIKKALTRCSNDVCFGDEETCPYRCEGSSLCVSVMAEDALAYIQQLEAFAPPVTIGTPIFSVCYNEDRDGFFVKESTVAEIWYNCNGWFFLEERHVGPAFKKRDIGKLIYLNREEAEFICEEFTAKLPDPPKEG